MDVLAYIKAANAPDGGRQQAALEAEAARLGVSIDRWVVGRPVMLMTVHVETPRLLMVTDFNKLGLELSEIVDVEKLCNDVGTRVWTVNQGAVFESPLWPLLREISGL